MGGRLVCVRVCACGKEPQSGRQHALGAAWAWHAIGQGSWSNSFAKRGMVVRTTTREDHSQPGQEFEHQPQLNPHPGAATTRLPTSLLLLFHHTPGLQPASGSTCSHHWSRWAASGRTRASGPRVCDGHIKKRGWASCLRAVDTWGLLQPQPDPPSSRPTAIASSLVMQAAHEVLSTHLDDRHHRLGALYKGPLAAGYDHCVVGAAVCVVLPYGPPVAPAAHALVQLGGVACETVPARGARK